MSDLTWSHEYASGESSTNFAFPKRAEWVQCDGAGTVALVCEDGTTFTRHAKGGEIYRGPFASLTSTTCQYLIAGNGPAPTPIPSNGTAAQATIADAGSFTAKANVEDAIQELYQQALSAQKTIFVDLQSGMLAAGTPLAAFADNASSNPGITLADSKTKAVRWNNNASQTAVWYEVPMPQDLDEASPVVFHVLASKSGATVGDATTFTFAAFFQTVAALHDADTDCGGATGALTGNATAKTVAELTRSIAAVDVPAPPASLSFSIKPTDGTLGTDDALVHAIWLEYKPALVTS